MQWNIASIGNITRLQLNMDVASTRIEWFLFFHGRCNNRALYESKLTDASVFFSVSSSFASAYDWCNVFLLHLQFFGHFFSLLHSASSISVSSTSIPLLALPRSFTYHLKKKQTIEESNKEEKNSIQEMYMHDSISIPIAYFKWAWRDMNLNMIKKSHEHWIL